jgi:hypothetical protein
MGTAWARAGFAGAADYGVADEMGKIILEWRLGRHLKATNLPCERLANGAGKAQKWAGKSNEIRAAN